jgi:hypothetical protein
MRRRRMRAWDYGDNPRIRRSHREHKRINLRQAWERRYAGIKKKRTGKIRVGSYLRKLPHSRRRIRVKSYPRKR